jgi:hypothetical protein
MVESQMRIFLNFAASTELGDELVEVEGLERR